MLVEFGGTEIEDPEERTEDTVLLTGLLVESPRIYLLILVEGEEFEVRLEHGRVSILKGHSIIIIVVDRVVNNDGTFPKL